MSNDILITDNTMTMDDDLSRIGISLPKNLLERFDEILNYRGYSRARKASAMRFART